MGGGATEKRFYITIVAPTASKSTLSLHARPLFSNAIGNTLHQRDGRGRSGSRDGGPKALAQSIQQSGEWGKDWGLHAREHAFVAWRLLDRFEARPQIRVYAHQELGGAGSSESPAGGWRPVAISAARIATTRSRSSASAVIVARRIGVRLKSRRPSTDQTKCALQICCRGLNSGTTVPFWRSWALIRIDFRRLR
jgi:hypothetical protein